MLSEVAHGTKVALATGVISV